MTFTEFLEKIKNLTSIKNFETNEYKILFVDFKDIITGANVYEIKGNFSNTIQISDDYTDLYNNIIYNLFELGLETFNKLDDNKEIFIKSIDEQDSFLYKRKLFSKINFASNHISINGYIGPANFIISNSNNINFLNEYCKYNTNINKIIHDGILKDNEILMGRKNTIDQPGLNFIYQIENDKINYDIIKSGLLPSNHFMYFNF